jgi:hypothetical protein
MPGHGLSSGYRCKATRIHRVRHSGTERVDRPCTPTARFRSDSSARVCTSPKACRASRTLPGVSSAGKRCLRAGMQGESPPRSGPCGCTVGRIRRFHPRRRHSAGGATLFRARLSGSALAVLPSSFSTSRRTWSWSLPIHRSRTRRASTPSSESKTASSPGPPRCTSIRPSKCFLSRSHAAGGVPATRTDGTGGCRAPKSGATSRPYRRVPSVRHPASRRSQAPGCSCR